MTSTTGPLAAVERLLTAQNPQYLDRGALPWTADVPRHMRGIDMFLQGRDANSLVDTGTDIITNFDPQVREIGGPKRPGAPHGTNRGGDVVTMRTPLTEYEWPMEISWHDLNLQGGDPFTASGSQKIWDVGEKTNRDFFVGMMKQFNSDFFAVPSAEMFATSATGTSPIKSIFTGCNIWGTAYYDGTGAAGAGADGLFPNMANQQGLDPTEAKFARRGDITTGGATQLSATKLTYGTAASNATNVTDHLVDRMQELMDLLDWEGVPMSASYAQAMPRKPQVICCSREAASLMRRTVRAHGELFALVPPTADLSQQRTQFAGVPLMISDEIRNASVYPDIQLDGTLDVDGAANRFLSTGGCNEFGVNSEGQDAWYAGGVYYFFDTEATQLYLNRQRAFEIGEWKNLAPINEDIFRRLAKMIGNIHHRRFVTHGILHPSTAISGYAESA